MRVHYLESSGTTPDFTIANVLELTVWVVLAAGILYLS
jgi:hypothetical protein